MRERLMACIHNLAWSLLKDYFKMDAIELVQTRTYTATLESIYLGLV